MSIYFETKDLAVGYRGKPLIRNISIQIEKGEIVTLIGPNGAGKSTILKSITRHLQTICGTVYLDRQDLAGLSYPQLARKVAVVLTERMSPEMMDCWDVVASGRYPYTGLLGLLSEEDRRIVAGAMETVHVLELAGQRYDAISDGQRQRVLLARAICQQPEVIVLDEPTSYLDIRHKLELLDTLRTMARREDITVILSLHEIDLAQKISDRVVCVHGDEIAACGPPEEIFQPARIRELYGLERGSYDTLFGSVELPRPEGAPRVFVLSSCGAGIPVFRDLQKRSIPFAAGIIYENDVDWPVARELAAEVVSEQPFRPISHEALARAEELMVQCGHVICTQFPIGPCNEGIRPLLERARQLGR